MSSMSVSLSAQMRGFIKSRVESGDYHNESEYIRDLVRRDRERLSNDEELEKRLNESAASGYVETSAADIKADALKRIKARGYL